MNRKFFFLIFILILSHSLAVSTSFSAKIHNFTVSPSTISLPDQDPDSFLEVSSSTNLSVSFNVTSLDQTEKWVLDIYSDDDLISGGNRIPIGNVRWTVTGTATPTGTFYNGTFTKAIYIKTGEGPGDSQTKKADVSCNFIFYLQNLWTYATGNYTKVITLRVTVPGDVQSQTFTLSLNLASRAKLEFGLLALNFPDADPDSFPSIPANVNPLSVTSSTRTGSSQTATLTCLAGGDLISGTNTIAISNMTWTATGTGYVPGTMNKTTAQTAGSWTGPEKRLGSFNYFLTNSWSYMTGNYSTTITYTLTAP